MADMSPAAAVPPLDFVQPAAVPRYPTLDEIVAAQDGAPVRFCWKDTNGTALVNAPGGWTNLTQEGNEPNLNDREHVVFVFQRLEALENDGSDSEIDEEDAKADEPAPDIGDPKDYAANALMAMRLHQGLRIGGKPLEGNTLLILMTMNKEGYFSMPAYPYPTANYRYFGFIQTMERLAHTYADEAKKPVMWLASRSMTSLPCSLPYGWTGFLNRPLFRALHQCLQVVYQVPSTWPSPEAETEPFVPWMKDSVLPVKWTSMPLLTLVRRPLGENAWHDTIRMWLQEEYLACTAGMPADKARHVREIRGNGRLEIVD